MPDDELPKRPGNRPGCGCYVLLVAGLLAILLVAAFLLVTRQAARRVEAELARIRAAGEPVTPTDLEDMYDRSPADPDTAGLWLDAVRPLDGKAYEAAAEKLPIVGDSEAEIPPPGQEWPDLEAAQGLLRQHEASLRWLHQAAEQGGAARYPISLDRGYSFLLPHVQWLRDGARLLALEAHVRAHQGDAHAAARSIHAILMLGRSLEREPLLVSQLVRITCDGLGVVALRRLLPDVEFADEDLELLQADLRAADYKKGMERAMLGERVLGMQAMRDPSSRGPGGVSTLWLFRNDDLSCYLGYMGHNIAATRRPWPQARWAAKQAGQELDDTLGGGSILPKLRYAGTGLLSAGLEVALVVAARVEALNGAADVAIAVQRYRRERGKLPKRLEELVPKFLPRIPIDPYDGQPLRYVVRKDEYVIYSVGTDGVDDGGQCDEDFTPDVAFPVKIRRPQQKGDPPSTPLTPDRPPVGKE